MAIREATLATVPVKRVWRLVKPLSKGEPDCACAATGSSSNTLRSRKRDRTQLRTAWTVWRGMTRRIRRDISTSLGPGVVGGKPRPYRVERIKDHSILRLH